MPLFSIIVPTYNSTSTITNTIDSIINQRYSDFEILIIDGKSSDNTLEIIQQYKDSRIKIFSEPDDGVYDAMNKGIKIAKGEWLYFLGSDDKLKPNTLGELIKYDINDFDLIYGDVQKIPSNIIYDGKFDLKKLFSRNICHQAIFTKKKIFENEGVFNIKYKTLADYALNIKVFTKNYNIKYLPIIIASYHENGLSANYFDYYFWKDYNKNYIKPFKNIISKNERYNIVWNYYHHLLYDKKSFFKALNTFCNISIHEQNKKNSSKELKNFIHILKLELKKLIYQDGK